MTSWERNGTVTCIHTYINVSESYEVAALTVSITMPPRADPIEKSFSLIVNAIDGTATGVPWA